MSETVNEDKGSKRPSNAPIITFGSKGVELNWRTILIILAVLGVGSAGGNSLLNNGLGLGGTADLSESLETHVEAQKETNEIFEKSIGANSSTIETTQKNLKKIGKSIQDLQVVQFKTDARNEARRITKEIPNRKAREVKYDTIYDLNMRRLKNGEEPCLTIRCE